MDVLLYLFLLDLLHKLLGRYGRLALRRRL